MHPAEAGSSRPRPSALSGRARQTDLRKRLEGGTIDTGLPPEHEHELLRIAQEAVSNAVRHAHPKTVKIKLQEEANHIELTIIDDGIGMEEGPERCTNMGFGLENMSERAKAIGGVWTLVSKPGQGTCINVRVPKRQAK